MRTCGNKIRLAAFMAVALATAASAQREQWLQYHTSAERRGYRWLELTSNAPPGVALPKLGPQPFFAHWKTPLDAAGGRWMCFDRTRRSGSCNRLHIDRNGNGQLEDESPLSATRVDSYSAYFEPVRLVFKGEDGPVTYHLIVRFMRYSDDDARVLVQSGCCYAGKVELAGQKRLLTLVDGNVNGAFNDSAPTPAECDRVVLEGDEADERFLGQLLEVGDQFLAIEVARDGAFVKVQPAKGLALGQVRVPETISEFIAVGAPGHFIRKPAKGEFTLPAGKYRVCGWSIDRKDDKGAAWKLSGEDAGEFASFEVTAEKPATLEVGEPILAALTARESRGAVGFSLHLKGRLGEPVELLKGKDRARAPRLHLASTGSSFRATNNFQYG